MRLLDTTSLTLLTIPPSSSPPPYAILSHTWSTLPDTDEPTLQDLLALTAAGRLDPSAWTRHPVALKRGTAKVRAAAALARAQGYAHLWVDTVCLDRTSPAEVEEAVNAMWGWYAGAAVCYVYLEDVDVGPGIANPDISRCRWFGRGWTLGEMLAPGEVAFYDYKWSFVGWGRGQRGRADFREQLARTTGVDGRVLRGEMGVRDVSVAGRMAWAAGRKTSRPEDAAYCLMGMFGVNMPLLYGEGAERAFVRLQEEILRSVDDYSLFAWKRPRGNPASNLLSGLLAPSPDCFRGTGHVTPDVDMDVSLSPAPSEVTNAGLHVRLRMRPVHADDHRVYAPPSDDSEDDAHTDFVALLDCTSTTTATAGREKKTGTGPGSVRGTQHAPALRLVALGGGQFARIRSDELLSVEEGYDAAAWRDRYVYVRQEPAWVLPEVVVDPEAEGVAVPRTLVEVHPPSRWDRAARTLRSGRSRQGGVVGGFRYRVARGTAVDEKADYLDVFVVAHQVEGQLGNWFGVAVCREVEPGKTLRQAFDEVLARDDNPEMMTAQNVSSRHGLTAVLDKKRRRNGRVSFRLGLREGHQGGAELDGREVFATGSIRTTANLLRHRAETEHLLALTRRMACEVVNDSLELTFAQRTNAVLELPSKIRMARPDGSARSDLAAALERVERLASEIQVSGEDGGDLGAFEGYFANRLAAACIRGDAEMARELATTKLVAVSLESKTSGRSFPSDRELCAAFLAFRPIHWAAVFGHADVVRLLTEAGADRYSKTLAGFTTVHLAAMMGHGDLVEYLLASWTPAELCDLNRLRRGRLDEAPGHLAAAYNRTDSSSILWAAHLAEAPPDQSMQGARNGLGETPLHRAAAMNNAGAVSAIAACAEGVDVPDGYGRTPLWHAAATGAEEAVRCLLSLSAGVDEPDVYGRTPLHIACREGRAAVVGVLLEAGAEVHRLTTAPCLSAVHFAALAADIECLRLVIGCGEKGEKGEKRHRDEDHGLQIGAVHIAAANGWLEGVRLLVERGHDTDTPCSHLVTARGHSQTDAGVKVARLRFNNAMELAVRGGHRDVVEFLRGCARSSSTGV